MTQALLPPAFCEPRPPGGAFLEGAGAAVGQSLPTGLWALLEPALAGLLPLAWLHPSRMHRTPKNGPLLGRSCTLRQCAGKAYAVRVSLAVEQTCFLWLLFVASPSAGGREASLEPLTSPGDWASGTPGALEAIVRPSLSQGYHPSRGLGGRAVPGCNGHPEKGSSGNCLPWV